MKRNIAIIAGGDSSEYEISIESAAQMLAILDKSKFNRFVVSIRKDLWEVQHPVFGNLPIDKNDFSFLSSGETFLFDCALIAMHGTPGEDGRLQAYFDLLKLPYTSSGMLSSALTFNKYACKIFLKNFGINTAKAVLIRREDRLEHGNIFNETGLPCIVKPNNGGSSFGVSKVDSAPALNNAFAAAFKEDDEIIIEEYIKGRELTCGLLKTKKMQIVLPVTEILSKKEFFDYEAKYKGMADEITPANIPGNVEKLVKETSLLIYDVLDCRGIVRIDYIFSDGKLYFLEVNSVPGMTKNSIVPQQTRAAGLDLGELFTHVIEEAIEARKLQS